MNLPEARIAFEKSKIESEALLKTIENSKARLEDRVTAAVDLINLGKKVMDVTIVPVTTSAFEEVKIEDLKEEIAEYVSSCQSRIQQTIKSLGIMDKLKVARILNQKGVAATV